MIQSEGTKKTDRKDEKNLRAKFLAVQTLKGHAEDKDLIQNPQVG